MGSRRTWWPLVVALVAMTAWSIARARDDEEEICVDQCKAQHDQCVDYCGEHRNPIECDADCREEFQDCVHECRR